MCHWIVFFKISAGLWQTYFDLGLRLRDTKLLLEARESRKKLRNLTLSVARQAFGLFFSVQGLSGLISMF